MPFVAKNVKTGERVDITEIANPRIELKSGEFVCQLCEQPMIIKAGMIVAAHFAHKVECSSDYEAHAESAEHRLAKKFIAARLKTLHAEYIDADIKKEVPIPEANRVADILATFPMGWRVAHEIQLSPITIEHLQLRTDDYARAGIDVVWWLGNSANTQTNRNWCLSNYGYCYDVSFTEIDLSKTFESEDGDNAEL